MPECGPIPKPRNPADPEPAVVSRADVEHLIAEVLHEQYCGTETYEGDPSVASADRGSHAWDARLICDALAARGWTVRREAL